MSFSAELIELAKKKAVLKTDAELIELVEVINKQNLSAVKNGKRPLTDVQALAIAECCGFNSEWVLVNLAAETTKSEAVKSTWSNLAKKLSKAVCVVLMSGIYFMGAGPDIGKHVFLRRSRLFA